MSFFQYILLALAIGINLLVTLRSCAMTTSIRLSRGLCDVIVIAVVYAVLLGLGLLLGNVLCFRDTYGDGSFDRVNSLVYLGLMIVTGVKMLASVWKKNQVTPAFDISRLGVTVVLAVATGVNVFLDGMALGFMVSFVEDFWRAAIPMAVVSFLLGYLGIMMGRQKKEIKERRWLLIAVLLLLVAAVFRVVEY